MSAGDDLLRYLIVPDSKSSSNFSPSDSDSRPQEEYWRALGQLQEPVYSKTAENTAKRQKMEVDTPNAVPALPHPSNVPGQILSVEEFMASRKPPVPTIAPEAQPAPQPRAIAARSSKHIIELHEKFQVLGIPRPNFVFTGGSSEGWSAQTDFLERELTVEGPCRSKQEAKEKLSELCLGVVHELEREGKLQKVSKAKKQKMENVPPEVVKKEEPMVNYVGQLLEFQRSIGAPQPTYIDYQLGQSFSCEATLDTHPTPFGSRTTYFTSKKAARQHAASCAVKHFQDEGLWPTTFTNVGGIKKVKPPSTASPSGTSTSTSTPNSLPSTSSLDAATGSSSFAQRVAHLATQLSLSTPEWRYTPSSASAPGFHTVACFFKNGGPHEGPLGEVRHVFGKKKAKEECARLVLEYLEGVKRKRLERARGETEVVAGRTVRRAVEEEEEGEAGDGTGGFVMQHDDSEDDGFESATERMN